MVGGRMNRADCVEHTTSSYLVLPVHLYGEVVGRGRKNKDAELIRTKSAVQVLDSPTSMNTFLAHTRTPHDAVHRLPSHFPTPLPL